MTPFLGVACGIVVALPFAAFARSERVTQRARSMAPRAPNRARPLRIDVLRSHPLVAIVARVGGAPRRRRRARRRDESVRNALPVMVDLIAVGVGAGCTPLLAI